MNEKEEKVFNPTGISLTEIEAKIVQDESYRSGINNFSATLRMIVREWAEIKEIQSKNKSRNK